MLSSIRLDGTTACMTIEGATDTDVFRAFVKRLLVPTPANGGIVIMDNLSPHKSEPTLSLIAAAGATARFLPGFSSDFNPIETMWGKVKNSLRRAEARSVRALRQAIIAALAQVIPTDAARSRGSCGYSFI